MELKDKSNLKTPVEMGVTPVSERNDPKNHKVYDILFSPKENETNSNIGSKNAYKDHNKITFGSVSTLDWLNTWRSLEEN